MKYGGQTASGLVDVKVDAGNGRVLAQDSGQDKEGDGHETTGKKVLPSRIMITFK